MKKQLLVLPLLSFLALTGCKSNSSSNGLSWKSGDKVYYERILFDTSDENADNAHIYLGEDGKVDTVKLGREEIKFGYSGKVLTLEAEGLRKAGPGEKTATVTFKEGKKKTVEIFNATKFIKTAEDFQGIGASEKACQGYYVLANDIDCSSIDNFEPIGQFFSEEDPTNFYFHGILDGDGYSIKNVKCSYSDGQKGVSDQNYPSNYDVYTGRGKFQNEAHVHGDNIGIFQVIGSSGVVRNVTFDNCSVHGRTIVGVIAGNVMGQVDNVLIKQNCSVLMDTHFYDDDCNTGAAFGIVAGSGKVQHVVSLTKNVRIVDIFEDYGEDYIGKIGNGWDHSGTEGNTDAWWRFAGVSKQLPDSETKIVDNNGKPSNGVYSVIGKCWGQVLDSVGASFKVVPYGETGYDVAFGHTHTAINKPTSGDSDLGAIENCAVYTDTELKTKSTYSVYGLDTNVWEIVDGEFPTMKQNVNSFDYAQ